MEPLLGSHCSHRFRIKSTAGEALGALAGAALDVGAVVGEAAAPPDAAGRRALGAGALSVIAGVPMTAFVGALAGAFDFVLAIAFVAAGGPWSVLAADVSGAGDSSLLGGGGGMSRAGPVVGSYIGVADAMVVAALVSELESAELSRFVGGPDTAAATSTPPSDIAASNPAHGTQAGTSRLWPGMIAVGRSRRARSACEPRGRAAGPERPFSRW